MVVIHEIYKICDYFVTSSDSQFTEPQTITFGQIVADVQGWVNG